MPSHHHSNLSILAAALVLVCALGACSKSPPGANAASSAAANASAPGGTACDRKLLTLQDVQGILSEPVTATKPLKGDAQTCYFITATNDRGGPELMVTLRPGLGKETLATFTSGKMNAYATWEPMSGVGDEAIWMTDLREANARKDDLLCNVRASGLSPSLSSASKETQQKTLGALCNKIFAAN